MAKRPTAPRRFSFQESKLHGLHVSQTTHGLHVELSLLRLNHTCVENGQREFDIQGRLLHGKLIGSSGRQRVERLPKLSQDPCDTVTFQSNSEMLVQVLE